MFISSHFLWHKVIVRLLQINCSLLCLGLHIPLGHSEVCRVLWAFPKRHLLKSWQQIAGRDNHVSKVDVRKCLWACRWKNLGHYAYIRLAVGRSKSEKQEEREPREQTTECSFFHDLCGALIARGAEWVNPACNQGGGPAFPFLELGDNFSYQRNFLSLHPPHHFCKQEISSGKRLLLFFHRRSLPVGVLPELSRCRSCVWMDGRAVRQGNAFWFCYSTCGGGQKFPQICECSSIGILLNCNV